MLEADEINAIAIGVQACTYPAAAFHHREHCLLTAYLLREHADWNLRFELPKVIRRYNLASGGANTADAGYHHTLTMFYLDAISHFLEHAPTDLTAACRLLLASPIADKDYALALYSRERLYSRAARAGWIAPDRGRFATMQETACADTIGAPFLRSPVDEPK